MIFTKSVAKFGVVVLFSASSLAAISFSTAATESFSTQLLGLQQQWAKVNYQLVDDAQKEGFDSLIKQAQELVKNNPHNANGLIWLGIIESSYAGAKGGLGALSLAKTAKKSLEESIKIDDSALNGSAYASLGTLYHKVPGWPIAFGDDDTAKEMLEKAMVINPNGIDSNYFYAEFLFDEKEYTKAKEHLTLALQATPRLERPLADEFRRVEVSQLMAKVDKKIQKK
ncbi:MAG: tetratricopeptide (TPR) repeat protein [Glaciecola sp.]|jgi:tetratricopeptide (TPR) repeat protein